MAVTITTDEEGSKDRWQDEGRDKPTYRYRVVAGGALQVISTPSESRGLEGSSIEVTFAPGAYWRAEGTYFGGTDADLGLV